jgi:hypothetical protein
LVYLEKGSSLLIQIICFPVEYKGIERRGDETIPLANKAGTEKQDI